MAIAKSTPSTGGFGPNAGRAITPPLNTSVDANGNARKSIGGSYRPKNFRNAGPRGIARRRG